MPNWMSTLDDIFVYADITNVRQTEIDTVIIECTVRGNGKELRVEDDDIDLAVREMMRKIDREVWLLDDICRAFDVSIDELRELIGIEDAKYPVLTFGYSDGYNAGYEDALEHARMYDADFGVQLDRAESKGYDEGYLGGLHDSLDKVTISDGEIELDDVIALAFDDGYEAGLRDAVYQREYERFLSDMAEGTGYEFERDFDDYMDRAIVESDYYDARYDEDTLPQVIVTPSDVVAMNPELVLAAQPLIMRDPNSDDLYLAYKVEGERED